MMTKRDAGDDDRAKASAPLDALDGEGRRRGSLQQHLSTRERGTVPLQLRCWGPDRRHDKLERERARHRLRRELRGMGR
jgi:hypothetical protein